MDPTPIPANSSPVAIAADRVFDPATKQVLPDHAVVCVNGMIDAVIPRRELATDVPCRIHKEGTLLPGLIDCHVHLAIDQDDYQFEFLRRSSATNALKTLHHARNLAREGWTTLRIAGDADRWYAWLDVARAIARGEFWGPNLCGAAHYISPTGGGGDLNHAAAEHCLHGEGLIADGSDEMRKAVRQECKGGSDWIKVLLSGAYMSQGDDPDRTLYSQEEFTTLVEEATRWGRPVMVHAHGNSAIKQAIRGGARSIEHGTNLDQEAIDLFCAHDTYLVPTLAIGEYYLDELHSSKAQAAMIEKTLATRDQQREWLRKGIKAGVRIAVGSDLGGYPRLEFAKCEFVQFVELGMSAADALAAGTSVAAALLNRTDELGCIAPGAQADLLVCHGAPDQNIHDITRVAAVYQRGQTLPKPVLS